MSQFILYYKKYHFNVTFYIQYSFNTLNRLENILNINTNVGTLKIILWKNY